MALEFRRAPNGQLECNHGILPGMQELPHWVQGNNEHLLRTYRKARKVWTFFNDTHRRLGINVDLSWREIISSIPPGTHDEQGQYTQSSRPLNIAADILRSTTLWQIWYARNRLVFQNEASNTRKICSLAWRDTILAGMAQRNHTLTFYSQCSEERRHMICQGFKDTWCKNDTFSQAVSIVLAGILLLACLPG